MLGRGKKQESEGFSWQDEATNLGFGDSMQQETADVTAYCAWCLQEAGIDPGEGSHGICSRHAAQMYSSYRASRRRC